MSMTSEYAKRLRQLVADAEAGDIGDKELLGRALITTAVWRSKIWANTLVQGGTHVRSGPFKGMNYVVRSAEGALLPRLQGVYERELHPALAQFATEGLEAVVDIGCAEGYYAVGLARMMPEVTVHAYDTDPVARRRCGLLAAENGVADRVVIGEEFAGEDFAHFARQRTLIFLDAEGIENELLDPSLYPALGQLSLIVETHPMARPGVTERLMARFAATHDIQRIDPSVQAAEVDPQLSGASHLEMVLAVWEWRAGPTPWLVMRPKGWNG